MRFWVVFPSILTLGVTGFYLSKSFLFSNRQPVAMRALAQEPPSAGQDEPSSLSFAMNKVLATPTPLPDADLSAQIESQNPDEEVSPVDLGESERKLDLLSLSSNEQKLVDALGDSALANQIRRVILAGIHSEQIPGTEELTAHYLNELLQAPGESTAVIQSALQKLPRTDGPDERISLILLAGKLGDTQTAHVIAMNELTASIVPVVPPESENGDEATFVSSIVPLTAHAVLLRNTTDAQGALAVTLDGIVAQPNESVREKLKEQFLQSYPASETELHVGLAARGLPGTPAAEPFQGEPAPAQDTEL